jgi:hypothetical protein
MENVIFSVMNDALSSPLNVTAQMFVISKYNMLIYVYLRWSVWILLLITLTMPNVTIMFLNHFVLC